MIDVLIYRFTPPGTLQFQDNVTRMVSGITFSTKLHGGFGECDFDLRARHMSAWDWYDRRLLWMVQIVGNGNHVIWEGRIEDMEMIPGGVHVTALGFYAHTRDKIYGIPWPSVAQAGVRVARVGHNYVEVDWDDAQIQAGESWTANQFVTTPPSYYVVLEAGGTDGKIEGATWDADDPFGSANKYSLLFNNATHKLTITPPPQASRWNFTKNTDFTVELWLKVIALPSNTGFGDATEATIISNEPAPAGGMLTRARNFFRINLRSNGQLAAYISDGREIGINEPNQQYNFYASTTYVTGTGTVSTGTWHRIALVVSRSFNRARLYLNNQFYGEAVLNLQNDVRTNEPLRVAFDNPGDLTQNLSVYLLPDLTKRTIHTTSLRCRVHGIRISNRDRWQFGELLTATADPSPDAFTCLLLHLNDNGGDTPLDSSRPGDGSSAESNTNIVANTTNRLTIQGTWESSLLAGDIITIGHRATQRDIITDAISLCPLISTDYTGIDPETSLNLDITPQEFDSGETVQDVIEHLCKFGSGDANLNPVYFTIWEGRKPFLQPYDTSRVDWRVRMSDITGDRSLTLSRSVKTMSNRTFAYYTDEEGQQQATGWFPDNHLLDMDEDLRDDALESQAEFGQFEGSVSIGQAFLDDANQFAQQLLRDELLPDQSSLLSLRGTIGGPAGARHPLWAVRAGDVIEIVDIMDAELPINQKVLRKLRRFVVKETRYDADQNRLDLTPEGEIATVEMLLAIAQIGSQRV